MLSWDDFIKGLNVFRSLEGLWLDIYNMIYLPRDRLRSLERYFYSVYATVYRQQLMSCGATRLVTLIWDGQVSLMTMATALGYRF